MNGFDFDFSESGYWLEPDFVLSDIVTTLVNLMGIPIGVTLFVKGIVVTGVLVSENEYLANLTNVFNRLAKESMGDNYEPVFDFTALNEGDISHELDGDEDEVEVSPPVRHLHLKEVFVLTPQPSIAFARSLLPILRIRLTAVDGWFLGQAMTLDDDIPDDGNGNGPNGNPRVLH